MTRSNVPLLLLLALPIFAQSDPVSRSWNQPVAPFRITGNLYYVGASDITSYLITTPRGHILLDGGFVETAPMILANIRTLGFDPKDVRILLSSHAHYDHAGGLAELKRVTGAKFHSSLGDLPQHARGGLDDPQFGNKYPYPPITADRIVRDGTRITLGGTTLVAHITPGHTPGCTTWTARIGKHDVVFVGSPSVPSEYRLIGNPRYPNAVEDYRAQFRTLKRLDCDIFLASHGAFFGLAEMLAKKKRWADGDEYKAFVSAAEKRFEDRISAPKSTMMRRRSQQPPPNGTTMEAPRGE
ncbi:MAG TPA: subclass B3 metallo-beta-lactamase [Thermoanaerobaculia bacterium]|nr:subclass B3 metallo-beta-lactamase [Thermoanaerobaculia bacterium]